VCHSGIQRDTNLPIAHDSNSVSIIIANNVTLKLVTNQ